MASGQIFKAIYFPDYRDTNQKSKGFILAFGERNKDLYNSIAHLGSNDLRGLLGTDSYLELEWRAKQEGLPVNTYCLWYLRKNLEIESSSIRRKDYFPLNKINLRDALDGLKDLPDESCDVIIADPPYNIGKDFGNNTDKRELGEYVTWCKIWINECIRIMKPTGTMFVYGFSEILAHLSVEIPINKRWLIWHYTNKNVASLNFWQRSHESIICAWKDNPIFNRDDVREPYTEGFLSGAAGKVRKGTIGRFSKSGKETIYKAHARGALPRDVIKTPALAGGAGMVERWFLCKTCDDVFAPKELNKHLNHDIVKHPTQKPFFLSQKLISSSMPKDDGVVLVPFAGMGSECASAKKLGQKYIGFEINPDYIRIAEKLLDNTKAAQKLF